MQNEFPLRKINWWFKIQTSIFTDIKMPSKLIVILHSILFFWAWWNIYLLLFFVKYFEITKFPLILEHFFGIRLVNYNFLSQFPTWDLESFKLYWYSTTKVKTRCWECIEDTKIEKKEWKKKICFVFMVSRSWQMNISYDHTYWVGI